MVLMAPEVNMSRKSHTALEISPTSIKENGDCIKWPEEKLVDCGTNCVDNAFHMEVSLVNHDQLMASRGNTEDVEVEVVRNMIPDVETAVERESLDVSENSSSFGRTNSGIGTSGGLSDTEVESRIQDDNGLWMGLDGLESFDDLFRTRLRKKLTDNWRKFIHPLMWRCKWVELQIRELQSQVSKYDRELLECDRKMICGLENCASEDLAMKSAPFFFQNRSLKVMKRKKRKRVEETVDLASYTSCHSLFSYFASRGSSVDVAFMDDNRGNAGKTPLGSVEFDVNDECSPLKDNDAFETILREIEEFLVHAHQLRVRMDRVVEENAELFTSDNSCFAPCDPLASHAPNSVMTQLNGENFLSGSMPNTSQQISEKLVIPSGCKEVNPLPDLIKTTDQPQIGRKRDKIGNEILVYNRALKKGFNNPEEVGTRRVAASQLTIEGEVENAQHVLNPNSPCERMVFRGQESVQIQSISEWVSPENKRKRGKRKARAGKWCSRSPG